MEIHDQSGPATDAAHAALVEQRVAALEGAEAAALLSSGMAATACALLALLRPGDHLLASAWIPDVAANLLSKEFTSLGIDVTLVDPTVPRVWRKHLRKKTRAVFVETPVKAVRRVLDLRPMSYLTKECGIALVVDSTVASPVNLRPIEHGADVVIHSAGTYLAGSPDILAGVVCGTSSYVEEVRQKLTVWGQTSNPFAAWWMARGLETLDVRMQRHNQNAMTIAEWCEGHEEIRRVYYPGLPSHPDHAVAAASMDGFGGMMAIELAGAADTRAFLGRLRLIQNEERAGGVQSTAWKSRTAAGERPKGEGRRKAAGEENVVQLSIGIERANDLIGDLEQALH